MVQYWGYPFLIRKETVALQASAREIRQRDNQRNEGPVVALLDIFEAFVRIADGCCL